MGESRTNFGGDQLAQTRTLLAERVGNALRHFDVTLDSFADHLSSQTDLGQADWARADQAALDDMALAFACHQGSTAAMQAFNLCCGRDFEMLATKLNLESNQRNDARQLLWQRLFVGDGGLPKILEYRGRGRLRHWFRVLASRFLLNEIRRIKRDRLVFESDCGELRVATERDPELMLLEQTYRRQFRAAFQNALLLLLPDQRNALRCHYIQSMTIDRMAEMFGIHRATAARRVALAREALLCLTCEQLRHALGADTEEIRSVIRRAQDHSSLSVARLLEEGTR